MVADLLVSQTLLVHMLEYVFVRVSKQKRFATPFLKNDGKKTNKFYCDLPFADMCGMRMCLEEMNCKTCSTFFLLSSLSCGVTNTPSSTSPADNLNKIWKKRKKERKKMLMQPLLCISIEPCTY